MTTQTRPIEVAKAAANGRQLISVSSYERYARLRAADDSRPDRPLVVEAIGDGHFATYVDRTDRGTKEAALNVREVAQARAIVEGAAHYHIRYGADVEFAPRAMTLAGSVRMLATFRRLLNTPGSMTYCTETPAIVVAYGVVMASCRPAPLFDHDDAGPCRVCGHDFPLCHCGEGVE